MRISYLIFFYALTFLLSSCGGDDDLMPVSAEDLIGDWTAVAVESSVVTESTFDGITTKVTASNVGVDIDYTMSLDGTNYITSGGYDVEGQVTIEGAGSFPVNTGFTDVSSSGTYTVSGNQLIADGDAFSIQIDGVEEAVSTEDQATTFGINSDGQLVLSLDFSMESTESGSTTNTVVLSSSTWEKR